MVRRRVGSNQYRTRVGIVDPLAIQAPDEDLMQQVRRENPGRRHLEPGDHRTPQRILDQLARSDFWYTRKQVASNPNAAPATVAYMAGDEHEGVRMAVARHRKVTPQVLSQLAQDTGWDVRRAVARNPITPQAALADLAQDEDWEVRQAVARNPQTPPQVLAGLLQDPDEEVRDEAQWRWDKEMPEEYRALRDAVRY
jgi:hypothetical protein